MNTPEKTTRIANKLTLEFNKIKDDIVSAHIAVGMITKPKFDFFRRYSLRANVTLVVGAQMATPPIVFEDLAAAVAENKMRAKVFIANYFHPKLYVFELKSSWVAFIGSGNFTDGGWYGNEEIFLVVTDKDTCESLKDRVHKWYDDAKIIDEKFLFEYLETANKNQHLDAQKKKNTEQLKDKLNSSFNFENVNFEGQFFTRAHHEAFSGNKPFLMTTDVLSERKEVQRRLFRLNDILLDLIPEHWRIEKHYDPNHVVAHIENFRHDDDRVIALWTAFGRGEKAIKSYGTANTTPLYFIRMQVIVGYDYVGVWLMPGKKGGGEVDRTNFRSRMQVQGYREEFYELLKGLGKEYFIEIMSDKKQVDFFTSPDHLWEYTRRDNWQADYFTIGRDYQVGSQELKIENIEQTVINDFEKYYPLYEKIRDRTFG